MDKVLEGVAHAWAAMSGWEAIAVALSVAYLLLAMRQNNWCWYAAFFSTAIFAFLFWDVRLLMDSALHIYYLVMAVYGWWSWRKGATAKPLQISWWSWKTHVLVIGGVVLMSFVSGYLLTEHTDAALPYWDSFTTWGAVVTTLMVTRKVIENWIYWLVVDGVALVIYIDRELYLTALLMAIYLVIVVFGWFQWLAQYRQQQAHTQPTQSVTTVN